MPTKCEFTPMSRDRAPAVARKTTTLVLSRPAWSRSCVGSLMVHVLLLVALGLATTVSKGTGAQSTSLVAIVSNGSDLGGDYYDESTGDESAGGGTVELATS